MNKPIRSLKLRMIYNSRGDPTIEADVYVDGAIGRTGAPSGASTGKAEATPFPAGGVKESVRFVNMNLSKIIGIDASDPDGLTKILKELDGTHNYSRLGGNTAYAITIAAAQAVANVFRIPLFKLLARKSMWSMPYPLGNVLGGGKHAGAGAPDFQEILVCPIGAKDIESALAANASVHKAVREEIDRRDPTFSGGKGDEGAWAPKMGDEEAFDVVFQATERVSSTMGIKIRVGADFASSSLWNEKLEKYMYKKSGKTLTPSEQIGFVTDICRKYDLIYAEDPVHEDDFAGFAEITKRLHGRTYVCGDDLFVTSTYRLKKGIELKAANSAILKVNQAGALGDALDFARVASRDGISLITSHRSGDTPDPQIAHIAIATGSKMLKSGVVGGERVSKLNELLRINESEDLGMVKLDF